MKEIHTPIPTSVTYIKHGYLVKMTAKKMKIYECNKRDLKSLCDDIVDCKRELTEVFGFDSRKHETLEDNVEMIYDVSVCKFKIPKDDYRKKGNVWLYISHVYHNALVNALYKERDAAFKKGATEEDIEYGIDYVTRSEAEMYSSDLFKNVLPCRDFVDDIIEDLNRDGKIRESLIRQ